VAEALEPGQTESATFAEPGVYTFYCEIHPEMTGTITVDA
jgi:plastocyanin